MKTIIVSLYDTYSMEECAALAKSGGSEVVAFLTQALDRPHGLTYIGTGKLEELHELVQNMEIEKVIFDDSLSPLQISHINSVLGVDVIDKIQLILEIFAERAITKEAQLQVALSAMKYELPRLKGSYDHLSRLGGGGLLRGPGESKLDIKRNYYKSRITNLEKEIEKSKENRAVQRKKRVESGIPIVSLMGYTNVGKTTLFNRLAGDNAYADDRLFATLDPLARGFSIGTQSFVLVDTVGFIRKIPTQLIASFRATLEEINLSTIIVHVTDVSDPYFENHFESVEKTIKDLTDHEIPTLFVYNKIDLVDDATLSRIKEIYPKGIYISAKDDLGIEKLEDAILDLYQSLLIDFSFLVPYSDGQLIPLIRSNSTLSRTEYLEEGTLFEGKCPPWLYDSISHQLGKR